MLEEILKEVVSCEKQAQDNIRNSQTKAKEIVAQANSKAVLIGKNIADQMRELRDNNITQSELKADKLRTEILENGEAEGKQILAKAKKKSNIIIEEIIGRLDSKYANS